MLLNCCECTRNAFGAQSLINVSVPNRVASLKNGTPVRAPAGYPVLKG